MTEKKKEEKKIEYRLLGNSSYRVFPICLGTMGFGNDKGVWSNGMGITCTEKEEEKIFKKYLEIGGNFVDTADTYQGGLSEKRVGNLKKKYNNVLSRDELILATKFTARTSDSPNGFGNHKKNMLRSINQSLKNLKTDYIDILYVHWWDWTTDPLVLLKNLNEVVRSGKVQQIALSDAPAWVMTTVNTAAKLWGFQGFTCYQGQYCIIERSIEQSIVPACRYLNVGIVPWGTMGLGLLSGKKKFKDLKRTYARNFINATEKQIESVQDILIEISKKRNVSVPQVTLNWTLQQPGISSVLVGCRTLEQFEDSIKTLDFKLSEEEVKKISEASKNMPPKIFPNHFIGTTFESNNWAPKKHIIKPTSF